MLEIDPYAILWTIVNLLVLYLLMRKFLFGPVNAILDSRAKAIEDGLSQARQQQEEAQQLRSQYEAQLEQSREEAGQILSKARAQGEEMYQKTVADAQAQAKKLLEESQERPRRERENMLRSVRREAADLAVAAAEKVAVGSNEAIDAFLREAGEQR